MIALLLDHLWQSSIFAGGAALLVFALRHNGANVRFWLWFAASMKFLVPFAALTVLGSLFLTPIVAPVAAPAVKLMAPLAKPFSAPAPALAIGLTAAIPALPAGPALPTAPASHAFHPDLGSVLLALWIFGFLFLVLRWLVRWSRVRALLREAVDVQVDAPVAVKFSASRLEPGLVGILRPVILLPQGIEQQLSPAELKAVLAHELCHWRRHDNLLAAIHMLVEALFWFFPLVWWLGARLNAERERACDESVLAEGNDPELYAEGILKVCRAYLQSPLACVAGVSGAGLKQRIDAIMENRLSRQLTAMRKMLLGASAAASIIAPLVLGLVAAPMTHVPAQAKAAVASALDSARRAVQVTPAEPIATPDAQITNLPSVQTEAAASGQNPSANQPALPVPQAQLVAPPVLPEPLVSPVQVALNNLPAAPENTNSDEQLSTQICHNNHVKGTVISPQAIQVISSDQMRGFVCEVGHDGGGQRIFFGYGPCDHPERNNGTVVGSGSWCRNIVVTMNVRLADQADAIKMTPGQIVTLIGNFRVTTQHRTAYLTVTNAKVVEVDPFATKDVTSAPASDMLHSLVCEPVQLIDFSRLIGRRLCVQNEIVAALNLAGPELQAAASSAIRYPMLDEPSDNPDAITCRNPIRQTGSRFAPPVSCARNGYWVAQRASIPMGDIGPYFQQGTFGGGMPPPGVTVGTP